MLDDLGVRRVSLYVGWDGEKRREDSYTDLRAFYDELRSSENLPTTSQPSPGDFESVYRELIDAGHDIVSIHIASGLSGTCDSANDARRALEAEGAAGQVLVVDGQSGAGGLGSLVLIAAEVAKRGGTVAEVEAAIAETHEGLDIWFCLDTLEYLRRGGRIGGAQAMLGSALKVKPILTFGTEITPVTRVRTQRRARERMEAYLVELHDRGSTDWIIQHAQAADEAEFLVSRGREILGSEPLFCTEVGPVLGAHLGSRDARRRIHPAGRSGLIRLRPSRSSSRQSQASARRSPRSPSRRCP